MEIATAAVALLAPCLARAGRGIACKGGEATVAGINALDVRLRGRFEADRDEYARQTLRRLDAITLSTP